MTDHLPQRGSDGDEHVDAHGDEHVDVVLHEEHLTSGTERHAVERVRLERVVVTEQRTVTVDVRREEIRITREPITDGPVAPVGAATPDREPIVVILHEERLTIAKTIVPVERITLGTRTVTHDERIDAALRHEEVEVASAADGGARQGSATADPVDPTP